MLRWGTQEGRKVARTGCERGDSSWEKGETCYTCGKKRLRNVGRGEKESDRKEAITGQLSEVAGCSLGTR